MRGRLRLILRGKPKAGVYMCPNKECMEKAKKRRTLQRSFDTEISQEKLDKIFQELSQYEKES